ncbi:MAG TPA: DNA polymerase III subunit delta [Steroidobacteraceae bacterium]|nr:DNA polymerase III subunit delta [Steroidobacteraceae bacterium]
MRLHTDALGAHLQQQLLRAYLVSGDEPLLVGEAADAVRARARASGFTEREVHFIERAADWPDVQASAGNLSLFGSRRLLEVRLSTGKPGVAGGAALVSLLQTPDPDTALLIMAPRLDRDAQSAHWVRAVEAHGAWVQAWPVSVDRLAGWLRARARKMDLDLADDALEMLAERTEGNLLAAHQELEKLKLQGAAGKITADVLLAGVADSARFDVFQLGETVLGGDADRALRMLGGLRAEGTEPTLVLWALNKAARDLWGTVAPGGGGARSWQRQTAALEKGARRAGRLPFGSLAARASRADRIIKGRLVGDAWDELALLAAAICGRPALHGPESVLK